MTSSGLFSRRVSGLYGGGADEEGGNDARAHRFRRNRQRRKASGFEPATGRDRCQVTSACFHLIYLSKAEISAHLNLRRLIFIFQAFSQFYKHCLVHFPHSMCKKIKITIKTERNDSIHCKHPAIKPSWGNSKTFYRHFQIFIKS